MRKLWLVVLMCIIAFGAIGLAKSPADTLVYMTYGTLNSLDPAYIYDTFSGGVIFNVYDNLWSWPAGVVDSKVKNLNYSLDTSQLVPMLCDVIPTVANGLVVKFPDGKVQYTVHIREGVKFQEGQTLTAEDVAYTFQRAMLQDRRGGPIWMFFEAFTGLNYTSMRAFARATLGNPALSRDQINGANGQPMLSAEDQAKIYAFVASWIKVTPDGKSVTFTLDADYPPFMSMLASSANWGAILSKSWCIEKGCWDGQATTWAKWYNPGNGTDATASQLYQITNGTGPYKLIKVDPTAEIVYERFDSYWKGPAPMKTVVQKLVQEWTDRFLAFQAQDADLCTVDPQYVPQVEALPGVVVQKNLPTVNMNPVMFFTTDIDTSGNDLCGDGQLGENGITSTFFNDVHVRRAFNYAFDPDLYISESYGAVGGYKTSGPIPQAFGWAYNPDPSLVWSLDLEAAKTEFQAAFDGQLWAKGFKFTIVYNEGNDARKSMAEMLEANIEGLNPKFHIDILGMPWSNQLDLLTVTRMPLFIIGWVMDYPDPHNFAQPFCQSNGGGFAEWQGATMVGIYQQYFDPLIIQAMQTADQAKRAALYYQVQKLSHDYATHIWLPQVNGYRVVQPYIVGEAFNPAFPDVYYYSVHKS